MLDCYGFQGFKTVFTDNLLALMFSILWNASKNLATLSGSIWPVHNPLTR